MTLAKAKVENAVLIAERWLLGALRDQTFFSVGEANQAIRPLLIRLNEHPFKKLPGHRREVFDRLDHPALKPLPAQRYEFAQWKKVGVNIDYHVDVDGHYYSVPYRLIRQAVMTRYTHASVELFHQSKRVDQACSRALKLNLVGYRHIESMLKNGRDKVPLPGEQPLCPAMGHDNVRGSEYCQ